MTLRLSDLPARVQASAIAMGGAPRPKVSGKAKPSEAAELFAFHLKAHNFTGWVREHRFALEALQRNWRFDFAHRAMRIAVEIEGLRVVQLAGQTVCTGRHSTPDGYREDMRKYNAAAELGWIVLRADQQMVKNGEAIATLERLLWRKGVHREGREHVSAPQARPGVG